MPHWPSTVAGAAGRRQHSFEQQQTPHASSLSSLVVSYPHSGNSGSRAAACAPHTLSPARPSCACWRSMQFETVEEGLSLDYGALACTLKPSDGLLAAALASRSAPIAAAAVATAASRN